MTSQPNVSPAHPSRLPYFQPSVFQSRCCTIGGSPLTAKFPLSSRPNFYSEDPWVTQVSVDITSARHLEKPAAPRCIRRSRPSKSSFGLDHVVTRKDSTVYSIITLRTFSISFHLRFSAPHPIPSCFTLEFYHRASPRPTLPFLLCACCRILHNDLADFLHFGHRCSPSTSLCGSVASKQLIRYCSLFFSTRLTRRILVSITQLSYNSLLAWPRQRQVSAAHFLPLPLCFECFFSRVIDWRRPEPPVPSIVFLVSCFFVISFNILVRLS